MADFKHTKPGSGVNMAVISGPRRAVSVAPRKPGARPAFTESTNIPRATMAITPPVLLAARRVEEFPPLRMSTPGDARKRANTGSHPPVQPMKPIRPGGAVPSKKSPPVGGAESRNAAKPQWECASCKKALGSSCVANGTALKLEGRLLCIACAKSGKPRARTAGLSSKILLSALGAVALVLGVSLIFIPSQVLLVMLLCAAGAVLTGMFCTSLSRKARIIAVSAGLAAAGISSCGLLALRDRARQRELTASAPDERAAVEDDLRHNCYFEATRRIAALKTQWTAQNNQTIPPAVQKQLDSLNALTETWLTKNYGVLNPDERQLLMSLWREFGSVAASQYKHFRAVRLKENSVELTVTANFKTVSTHSSINQVIDATEPLLRYLLLRPGTDSIKLTLLSAAPESDSVALATVSLDAQAVAEMRQGKFSALRNAVSVNSGR